MGKKKRKSEPGCIATIFGYLIFVCIIALIIDLIRTHISERAKHNLMVVAIVIGVIIFISMVCTIYRKLHRKYTLKQLDEMDGHQFEYACADILKANGYKHVKVTRSSGDFGVDIIAEKDKVRYAIQCKRYNHKLDNTPIQEVVGGLAYYQCDKGAVMTNQYFTEPAKQLAQVNDIELLDRDTLSHMVDKTEKSFDDKLNLFRSYLTSSSTMLVAYLEKCGIYSRIEDINTDTKTLSFTLKLKFADDIESVKAKKKAISKITKAKVIDIVQNENDMITIIVCTPRKYRIKS
ncbi:Restriction endonuclease [uncultured Ruminococcus sp.]|uniref:Restriction endonuclease n=1 Tax=Hominimerdicola aceti TaxID=2981726 RepID=A0AAE3IJN3_9FIRM|nr:restriction endonuclease [Hominimerdicola aceti]MCU6706659.1 restriction endonuclease [Hominimerdicola aceti]SCJ17012.1 Restriction endonuclease [uncultured Ruminococcus sp.]